VHNLLPAARHIFKLGPNALVIRRGKCGAMLVQLNRTFSVSAFPLKQVHDTTGTGDTFAGGFMGYLASVERAADAELWRAMDYSSVMGSFTVEKFGLDRLRTLERQEIHARAKHFYKMTQFTLQSLRGGAALVAQRKFLWNNRRSLPPDNAGTSMKFRAPKELLQLDLKTSPSR
jgi:bifunctional ADP-heptose synthase (sugar kinase/adenylyltransferase)